MKTKIDITKHISTGMGRAMLALSAEVEKNMDRRLFELVKIRASQLNQCAYCLDMHTKDARRFGETEQRIYALSACATPRSSPIASAPRWSGRRRSPGCPTHTLRRNCERGWRPTSTRTRSSR